MTTDLIKYKALEKADASAVSGFFRQLFSADQKEEFVSYDHNSHNEAELLKLRALLEKKEAEQDGQSRTMCATVALLKYAHKMIERAEGVIEAQENRIAQLEDIATSDDLTGLKNRRGFFDAFVRELDRCERGFSSGGLLILIDLDNFKAINDTHGHLAGDACLRLVARTLQSEIRQMDIAARLGGDEFVLLLSNTSKERAAGRAQELAWQLNHLSLAWYGEGLPVRASLGLRAYGAGDKAEKIFNDADIALYADKRGKKGKKTRPMSA